MGLIVGLRRRAARLATVYSLCPRCSTPGVQVVLRVRSWITVLLIPIVPFRTSYLASCTVCGGKTRVTPFQALEAIEQARLQHAEALAVSLRPSRRAASSAGSVPQRAAGVSGRSGRRRPAGVSPGAARSSGAPTLRERPLAIEREGSPVPAVLWEPEPEPAGPDGGDARGLVPLICVGHGGSGHKRQDYVVQLARSFVRRHGCRVLAVDGPVHGERRTDPDAPPQMVLLQFAQRWQQDPAMTDEMIADWRVAIDAVQALPDVGPGPVGWWGLSLGTILGLPLVAAEPRIEAAVLGLMGLSGPTRERLAAAAAAVRCPVLFLVQWHDELFPRDRAFGLFDAIGSADRRLHAHLGGHGAVPTEAFHASVGFLAERLGAPLLPAADRR